MEQEELKLIVKTQMQRYFKAKDQFHILTEENKLLTSRIEQLITTLPKNSLLGSLINKEIDEYFASTKAFGDTKNMNIADELRQTAPLSLTLVKNETKPYSKRAAFVNIAILIYGIANIGFILAIALMK